MEENNQNSAAAAPEKIDLTILIDDAWRGIKKFWLLCAVLILLCAAGTGFQSYRSYTPSYMAYTTFVVQTYSPYENARSYSDYNNKTATQLSETFPYILNSRALRKIVCQELGEDWIPETITAEATGEETALFTIKVVSLEPQRAWDVLQAVINHYPEVARYIIGETDLTIMDTSGLPQAPYNKQTWKQAAQRGAIVGAILSAVLILLYAMTRKTVRREKDLKGYLSLDTLGSVPTIKLKSRSKKRMQRILLDEANSSEDFNESIRGLRNRVLEKSKKEKAKVLVVTSAMAGEGKTTVAANLAIALAKKHYRVLLLDGDFRHPSVGQVFDIEEKHNYMEELIHGTNGNAVKGHKYRGIPLLVLNGVSGASLKTMDLREERMRSLFRNLRKACDFVIIDTPPCSVVADAAAYARCADAAILVVKQDYSRLDRILQSAEMISDTGIPILGYVINNVRAGITQSGNGYGYGYGYGRYGYGKYGYGKYGSGKYSYGQAETEEEEEEFAAESRKFDPKAVKSKPLWMKKE